MARIDVAARKLCDLNREERAARAIGFARKEVLLDQRARSSRSEGVALGREVVGRTCLADRGVAGRNKDSVESGLQRGQACIRRDGCEVCGAAVVLHNKGRVCRSVRALHGGNERVVCRCRIRVIDREHVAQVVQHHDCDIRNAVRFGFENRVRDHLHDVLNR